MVSSDKIFVGTELKFKIDIEAEGFSMDTDDFNVVICRRNVKQVFNKQDLINDGEGNYYVCFDTADFGTGTISAIVTAYVPDTDFPDGLRTEVVAMDLVTVNKV